MELSPVGTPVQARSALMAWQLGNLQAQREIGAEVHKVQLSFQATCAVALSGAGPSVPVW